MRSLFLSLGDRAASRLYCVGTFRSNFRRITHTKRLRIVEKRGSTLFVSILTSCPAPLSAQLAKTQSSAFGSIPRASASLRMVRKWGSTWLRSTRIMVLTPTPDFSASSCWVKSSRVRVSLSLLPICTTTGMVTQPLCPRHPTKTWWSKSVQMVVIWYDKGVEKEWLRRCCNTPEPGP
jgi:hypothetical protein